MIIKLLLNKTDWFVLANLIGQLFSRLEECDLVFRDENGRILTDVTSYFRFTLLENQTTETTEINILALDEASLNFGHHSLYNHADGFLIKTGLDCNFINEICFCHNSNILIKFLLKKRKTVQSYYKLLKYKSFFEKKLQICDFFCTFAPDLGFLGPKKVQIMLNSLFYNRLYDWYEIHHRVLPWRETEDPYCIWLSEIILQQTRVMQGMEYYLRFVRHWPDVASLAAADEAEVLREWQGLGYYSRARNLHKAAKMIVALPSFPQTFEELRALPGVGEYTAGAIASFAYNLPYPAMDGNVYLVVARLLDIDEPFDTSAGKKLFHRHIESLLDKEHARLFNSAIMEFGALFCTPTLGDNCATCPLQEFCLGYAHHTAELLPVRKPRPKVRDRWFTYHIYLCGDQTLIRRREAKDIWYHLYEFPCEEHPSPVTCNPSPFTFTHVLSHQKLHARFIIHRVQKMPDIAGTIVIRWDDLNDYALSRLTLRALDTMRLTPAR